MSHGMKFINPYNFIPVGESGPRAEFNEADYEQSKKYSGVIEYSLLTKTPLFIPNTSTNDAFRIRLGGEGNSVNEPSHKSYDFYSWKDLSGVKGSVENEPQIPVIPGSEIRGMLRSNYEILTNSCLSQADDPLLSKRTAQVFKAGIVKKSVAGEYALYSAKDCLLRTKNNNSLAIDESPAPWNNKTYKNSQIREGQQIWFVERVRDRGKSVVEKVLSSKPGITVGTVQCGYVIKGEAGPELDGKKEKHCAHVFYAKGKVQMLSEQELATMQQVLKLYKDNGKNPYSEYASAWRDFLNSEGEKEFPVYYDKPAKGTGTMLSPASITRDIYSHRISQILDKMGKFEACSDITHLCPGCALFGAVNNKLKVTSRLRFTDLILEKEPENPDSLFEPITTIKALSTPKLSNIEFYLKRPGNAWFWTYDYYLDANGKTVGYDPTINGRKLYWHQIKMKLADIIDTPSDQNTTIRPLKKNIKFTGRLFFNHISSRELDLLVYLLNGTENETGNLFEKKHGYKLGHGKPLGLGSIALNVERIVVQSTRLDEEKQRVVREIIPYTVTEPIIDTKIRSHFEKLTLFSFPSADDDRTIEYPHLKKGEEDTIFNWFAANHKGYDREHGKQVDMSKARNQQYIVQYMEAMNPIFVDTNALSNVSQVVNAPHNGGGNNSRNHNGGQRNGSWDSGHNGTRRNVSKNGGNQRGYNWNSGKNKW